jgi:hypothetical protein
MPIPRRTRKGRTTAGRPCECQIYPASPKAHTAMHLFNAKGHRSVARSDCGAVYLEAHRVRLGSDLDLVSILQRYVGRAQKRRDRRVMVAISCVLTSILESHNGLVRGSSPPGLPEGA